MPLAGIATVHPLPGARAIDPPRTSLSPPVLRSQRGTSLPRLEDPLHQTEPRILPEGPSVPARRLETRVVRFPRIAAKTRMELQRRDPGPLEVRASIPAVWAAR